MATLLTLYSICFGVGLLYVLVAGALGMHGGSGHDAGGGGDGGGLDAGHLELGGHDADAGDLGGDGDAGGDDLAGSAAPSAALAPHGTAGHTDAPAYSPFNLLSIMCFSAAFGGTGLIASALSVPLVLSFPLALAGGCLMAWLLFLLLTRVLFKMQSGSVPSADDMLGLEAEVLTPIEPGGFGEIAYILQGTRYTAPAKLLRGERVGRTEAVRIVKVEGSTVYVETRRKLLD